MPESDNIQFKKNMTLLEKHYPVQFDIVSQFKSVDTASKLVFATNQHPNIEVSLPNGQVVLIHDADNPGSEAATFLSMVPEISTGVVFMFGMGLGYSVVELLKKRESIQWVVVFELNPEFFIHALEQTDLSDILTDKRLVLCIGLPRDIAPVMATVNTALMLESIHSLSLKTCFTANPNYETLSSLVFDYVSGMNSEGNTKSLYGKLFIENRLKHLTSIHHDRRLEELTGKFKNTPALIVAAGPSLDKNIDQISMAVGRAVIISVDTALPSLLAKGVIPDFVTSIDYKELTYEKIANTASNKHCKKINLICTSWVTHKVTKTFPAKQIFWAFGVNAFEKWINTLMGGSMLIPGAGTVAHLNFISADIMGCDPIIFVGQDLAFPEGKGHASDVVLSSRNYTKKILDDKQGIMQVKGWAEPLVSTNRQMVGYLRGFEKMIKATQANVVNATEGGAFIKGTRNMTLSKAIDEFCKNEIDSSLDFSSQKSTLLKGIQQTLKEISKLEKVIKKADKLAFFVKGKLLKLGKKGAKSCSFSTLPNSLKKKVSDLDVCHKTADENPLWQIFDEMTMEGVRMNEREKREIERLGGIPEKYIDWLMKSVERIDRVNQIRIENLSWFEKQLIPIREYIEKEKLLLDQIGRNSPNPQKFTALAQLYSESGNWVLLDNFLARYDDLGETEGELFFYQGVIALCQENYKRADALFGSATDVDKLFKKRIVAKRKKLADNFLEIAVSPSTQVFRSHSIVMMLLEKGLKCCPDHQGIKTEIRKIIDRDLKKIKDVFHTQDLKANMECAQRVKSWIKTIEHKNTIADSLDNRVVSQLYILYGEWLTSKSKTIEALAFYQKALSISPENPKLLISMADLCFCVNDFEPGIKYLKQAVSLDRQYAVYWYNMGKNLVSQQDYDGAILAFEQNFIALPENIIALKEIGECYEKMGKREAAEEAYRQFKILADKNRK